MNAFFFYVPFSNDDSSPRSEHPAVAAAAAGGPAGSAGAALGGGFIGVLGLSFSSVTPEEVTACWVIDERHLQPHGIVHGGVYASVVETCCSVGAMQSAPPGMVVVGLDNHTNFVRAVRGGQLSARAIPLSSGRRAQLWQCDIWDERQRLIASGRVRSLCIAAEGREQQG